MITDEVDLVNLPKLSSHKIEVRKKTTASVLHIDAL
jgi:hypothetical protein